MDRFLINNYKKIEGQEKLKGYVDLYIPELKWMIPGLSLFSNGKKIWVNSPSRTYVNDKGETKYFNVVQMHRQENDIFSQEVIAALKKYDPKLPKPFEFKKKESVFEQDMEDLPF